MLLIRDTDNPAGDIFGKAKGGKMTIKEILTAKFTSARFLMAILFSTTYCLVILGCTVALLLKILAVETYVALVGAFALIVREIASDYFGREDRKSENGGQK